MLRFPIRSRPRKFRRSFGPGSGPAEREKRLQMVVTALIRHERIEGQYERLDETRQYAEQLINLAILHGDKHKPTMELADHWLLEKDLVHKLFKVLVPRYRNYTSSFARVYKLPRKYPGRGSDQGVLELKENPYPPVIFTQRNNENLLSNVLLRAVREDYQKGKLEVAKNYTAKQHLNKLEQTIDKLKENSQERQTQTKGVDEREKTS